MMDTKAEAEHFLSISHMFKLGVLDTEKQHPHTVGLSDLAKNNLPQAINRIKDLDVNTIKILQSKIPELENLYHQVNDTLNSGGNIYICGCGATGRLSLVLQTLWRQEARHINNHDIKDRIVSFMAGGDAALIKSVEDFQDHPQFAQQQLVELGFKNNDLLIGSTEGGETPWVIGAVWKSTEITKRKPYILYGNTDQVLKENVERSRKFIQSDKICKINMNVGSMAVSGSTRMQSTTILMYGIGLCLLGSDIIKSHKFPTWRQYASDNVDIFLDYITNTNFTSLQALTEYESSLYAKKEYVSYVTDSYYAISILTDTTERAPTFSLSAFENTKDQNVIPCWSNMVLLTEKKCEYPSQDARVEANWVEMLGGRPIRALDSAYWENYKQKVSLWKIQGFAIHNRKQHEIHIKHEPLQIVTSSNLTINLPEYKNNCRLSAHVLLKILLNNHSTLVMGRMSRYESNVMTYVRASNYKLIDRAARCIMMLKKGLNYADVIHKIYEVKQVIREDDPIVLKVIEFFEKEQKAKLNPN